MTPRIVALLVMVAIGVASAMSFWAGYEFAQTKPADGLVTISKSSDLMSGNNIGGGVQSANVNPTIVSGAVGYREISVAASQKRDAVWADGTESDIAEAVIKFSENSKNLKYSVLCGANVCQVDGVLPDAGYEQDLLDRYINGTGFAEALTKANAMPDKVEFDREGKRFTIYLSRVRR